MRTRLTLCGIALAVVASAKNNGRIPPLMQLKRTCGTCHDLEVVQVQRLTRDEWEGELRKMARMGARITDRKALLNYLEKKYGAK